MHKIGRAQLGNPKQSENRNELVTEMQSHLVLKFADKAKCARFSHKLLCYVTKTIVEAHQIYSKAIKQRLTVEQELVPVECSV